MNHGRVLRTLRQSPPAPAPLQICARRAQRLPRASQFKTQRACAKVCSRHIGHLAVFLGKNSRIILPKSEKSEELESSLHKFSHLRSLRKAREYLGGARAKNATEAFVTIWHMSGIKRIFRLLVFGKAIAAADTLRGKHGALHRIYIFLAPRAYLQNSEDPG